MIIKDWVAEVLNPIRTIANLDLLLDQQGVIAAQKRRCVRIGYPESIYEDDIPVSRLNFGSFNEYCELLKNRRYSALLWDGSFLQVSIDILRDDLIGHRYCYYPCPVQFKDDELRTLTEEEHIVDVVKTFLDQRSMLLLRTPIRIDFDSQTWKKGEPHVHIHFNHANCHCALTAPIYPSYFVKFIIRYFYPDIWHEYPDLELLSQDMPGYWLKNGEERFLHLTAKNPPM